MWSRIVSRLVYHPCENHEQLKNYEKDDMVYYPRIIYRLLNVQRVIVTVIVLKETRTRLLYLGNLEYRPPGLKHTSPLKWRWMVFFVLLSYKKILNRSSLTQS